MQFSFFREDTKVNEPVTLEKWGWVVCYDDGTGLHQFDFSTSAFHQFKEINLKKPFIFKVVDLEGEKNPFTILYSPETMQLFFFYRRGILDMGSENHRRETVIVFGYKKCGESNYFTIFPSGELVITDNLDLIHF